MEFSKTVNIKISQELLIEILKYGEADISDLPDYDDIIKMILFNAKHYENLAGEYADDWHKLYCEVNDEKAS